MKKRHYSLTEAIFSAFLIEGHVWAIGNALFAIALPFRGAIVGATKGVSDAITFPYQYFKDVWDFMDSL